MSEIEKSGLRVFKSEKGDEKAGSVNDLIKHLIVNDLWSKSPCVFKNYNLQSKSTIFGRNSFLDIIEKELINSSENNFHVVKYHNGVKKPLELKSTTSKKTLQDVKKAFKDGYTIQFFQPQRFADPVYHLISKFEELLGTLVGSSAYMTPSKSQGLAPHYDDVDVFILHTEGTKLWRLWENKSNLLPETYSNDLSRDTLPQQDCMEIILSPGDILYMPRGTIHEAIAQDSFATHITLSMYQQYNYKLLLQTVFPLLLNEASSQCIDYRHNLPIRLQNILGTFSGQCLLPQLLELQEKSKNNATIQTQLISTIHTLDTNNDSSISTGTNGSGSHSSPLWYTQLTLPSKDTNTTTTTTATNHTQRISSTTTTDISSSSLLYDRTTSIQQMRTQFKQYIQYLLSQLSTFITMEILDKTCDILIQDFITNRLPPPLRLPSSADMNSTGTCETSSVNTKNNKINSKKRSRRNDDDDDEYIHENTDHSSSSISIRPIDIFCIYSMYRLEYTITTIDDVQLIAIYCNDKNNRLYHMGHPSTSLSAEDDDDDDDDEDDDDDCVEEYSQQMSGYEHDDDDADMMSADLSPTLLLPCRLAPIFTVLQTNFVHHSSNEKECSIPVGVIIDLVKPFRIFDDEVYEVLQQLVTHRIGYIQPTLTSSTTTTTTPGTTSTKKTTTTATTTTTTTTIAQKRNILESSTVSKKSSTSSSEKEQIHTSYIKKVNNVKVASTTRVNNDNINSNQSSNIRKNKRKK